MFERRITESCMDVQYSGNLFSAVVFAYTKRMKGPPMKRPKPAWMPPAGTMATYRGRSRQSMRNVRVLAEASAGRMVVEAIGKQGVPVRLTVKRENLVPMQPDLFD
jgi:hypothetical protein